MKDFIERVMLSALAVIFYVAAIMVCVAAFNDGDLADYFGVGMLFGAVTAAEIVMLKAVWVD